MKLKPAKTYRHYSEEQKLEIVALMRELVKAGKHPPIWVLDWRIYFREGLQGPPEHLGWTRAAELVNYHEEPAVVLFRKTLLSNTLRLHRAFSQSQRRAQYLAEKGEKGCPPSP